MGARLVGADSLARKFEAMIVAMNGGTKQAVAESLADLEEEAKGLAPVLTGDLHDSITHEIYADDLSGGAGTNIIYGPAVEFGTNDTPAQPFLFPAAEIMKPRYWAKVRSYGKRAVRSLRRSQRAA